MRYVKGDTFCTIVRYVVVETSMPETKVWRMLSLRNVKRLYDNKVVAVHDFNFEIANNEFIVLASPSGCEKSTTLRMIASLEDVSDCEFCIRLVHNRR